MGGRTVRAAAARAGAALDAAGRPHVADFGLACRLDPDPARARAGQIGGTPRSMALEQARGEERLTVAADVYGLGGVLYARLCGQPPFAGSTVQQPLRQVLEEPSPSPRCLGCGIDLDLDAICRTCLAREPAEWYASAAAVADDLDRWLEGRPVAARPVGPAERARTWVRRRPGRPGGPARGGARRVAAVLA
jgi:serine/threonine protein kinase